MNISSIFMLNQQGNYAVPMEEQLPLVAREHLSEEDHANILKRMVVGKIASQVNKNFNSYLDPSLPLVSMKFTQPPSLSQNMATLSPPSADVIRSWPLVVMCQEAGFTQPRAHFTMFTMYHYCGQLPEIRTCFFLRRRT